MAMPAAIRAPVASAPRYALRMSLLQGGRGTTTVACAGPRTLPDRSPPGPRDSTVSGSTNPVQDLDMRLCARPVLRPLCDSKIICGRDAENWEAYAHNFTCSAHADWCGDSTQRLIFLEDGGSPGWPTRWRKCSSRLRGLLGGRERQACLCWHYQRY